MSQSTPPATTGPRTLGTGFMIVLGLALLTLAVAGIGQVGGLIGPIFLALTLAISVRPVIDWLRARGLPAALSSILVLLLMYAVLVGMVIAVASAVGQLATTLPGYQDRFVALYNDFLHWLAGFGVRSEDILTILRKFDLTSLLGIVPGLLAGLSAGSTQLLTLLLALAFLVLDMTVVTNRAAALRRAKPDLAEALADFAWRVRRYWLVSTVFGVMSATLDFVALLVLGVPLAFTWAVLAFVANYIPNIGFILALVPPVLLALLDGGPSSALWVIVAYCLINVLVQTVIQPRFIGNAVGLGTTLIFISLIFWSVILGPLGAVLAVPMTLFVKAIIVNSTPSLHWLNVFLQAGDDPPKARPDADEEHDGVALE